MSSVPNEEGSDEKGRVHADVDNLSIDILGDIEEVETEEKEDFRSHQHDVHDESMPMFLRHHELDQYSFDLSTESEMDREEALLGISRVRRGFRLLPSTSTPSKEQERYESGNVDSMAMDMEGGDGSQLSYPTSSSASSAVSKRIVQSKRKEFEMLEFLSPIHCSPPAAPRIRNQFLRKPAPPESIQLLSPIRKVDYTSAPIDDAHDWTGPSCSRPVIKDEQRNDRLKIEDTFDANYLESIGKLKVTPSVFSCRPTQDEEDEDGKFEWSFDQKAILYAVDIDEKNAPILETPDPAKEAQIQAALDKFWAERGTDFLPSPIRTPENLVRQPDFSPGSILIGHSPFAVRQASGVSDAGSQVSPNFRSRLDLGRFLAHTGYNESYEFDDVHHEKEPEGTTEEKPVEE